jgi:hypothetical protein
MQRGSTCRNTSSKAIKMAETISRVAARWMSCMGFRVGLLYAGTAEFEGAS